MPGHRETRRMRGAHDLLGIRSLAVIPEAAAEPVGMDLERAGLRADAALAGLACTFPMDGSGFLGHVFLLCVGWTSRHHSTCATEQGVVPGRASPCAHVLQSQA